MQQSNPATYDLLIIGGGINGAGIARDAAGRGLAVILAEMDDLASATSSASSKLIHGGLRYLEHYAFRLVREALAEREVLLAVAPHIIWPMRFVLPHVRELRPAWMVRIGLWLYDHLGGYSSLPRSGTIDLASSPYGIGLRGDLARGFVYSDCWVDDARLVILNARDAADRGADIRPRTRVVSARRQSGEWRVQLADRASGRQSEVAARAIVNASGPWAHEVLTSTIGLSTRSRLRMIKGSHIVVPRQYDGEHAFILQNDDGRVVFMIPYEGRFTLIGTTDVPFESEPDTAAISSDETHYLCRAASRYLARPVAPADVVWSYAGVRPLYDDGSARASEITRDYVLELDAPQNAPPVLSVFGGKITTYRRLAEHALAKLSGHFPAAGPPWTAGAKLPGGDLPAPDFASFVSGLVRQFSGLPEAHVRAMARRQGARALRILEGARVAADLGAHFGAGLYAREVDLMRAEEWAHTATDILYRRSKAGLHATHEERAALAAYLGN